MPEPEMLRVVFVDDDERVLESLRDALRGRRREWSMAFTTRPELALEHAEAGRCDVVVSDLRMAAMDGATLLERVRDARPEVVRIVLSGDAELDVISRASGVAHRLLAKPCDTAELARVVERSGALAALGRDAARRRAAAGVTSLPAAPRTYLRLRGVLDDPNGSLRDAATVVGEDPALAAKVLQLANSAFFGRHGDISDLGRAVVCVGLDALVALTLSAEVLASFRAPALDRWYPADALQGHAAAVSALTRLILAGHPACEAACAAALLHEVGLLVVATQQPQDLDATLPVALHDGRSLCEVEREVTGITYAEAGAHLLTLWGLPHDLAEAVAFHADPAAVECHGLDAITAVHIADALVHEGPASLRGAVPVAPLDPALVERLGVGDKIDGWRAALDDLATHEACT